VVVCDPGRGASSSLQPPRADEHELFRCMLFNALISNTDDHPRNQTARIVADASTTGISHNLFSVGFPRQLGERPRRNRGPHFHLNVALDERAIRAAILLAPHHCEFVSELSFSLVDDGERHPCAVSEEIAEIRRYSDGSSRGPQNSSPGAPAIPWRKARSRCPATVIAPMLNNLMSSIRGLGFVIERSSRGLGGGTDQALGPEQQLEEVRPECALLGLSYFGSPLVPWHYHL
jgi:hypothetical protein